MHGQQSEERPRKRHMWPVPANGTVGDSSSSKSFYKDERKITIGDCALFQAGNAPPFIGIIRCLTKDKEGQIKLGVNWLYRPADVKLGKGVLLEAAPNEVFYSFHKDEISAASLLHPCKVSFLRKGVELPPGISSFVCRRVYDTTNKCLWWLTDQDYTDERQEEVDQLLDKTKHEMHAVMQSGGPSPKDLNGMSSTLKTGSDNAQNSTFPSQVKGKKRERSDHNTDPVKRERLTKADGSEVGHFKLECSIRPEEIARITNKDGSLINSECVGQLVHLMQLDKNDATKKGIDLAIWRKELVGVIATTDRDDCLSQFVQLKGLPILDHWLQEAHKGKTGDTGSPKESDKVIEELLLTLLHALGKLPVDLEALKSCNVGKSVNHLRNHKNMDIQKKARNLVDTWKKRVNSQITSEMNNDTKSGSSQGVSLPCKQASGEVSHTHGGRRGVPAEAPKNSMPPNSSVKTVSNRSVQTDVLSRSTSGPSASNKVSPLISSTISSKDSHCKEEKSSSSSQSQNNSQSWSSEPGKAAGSSWKEDARSSTAGSMSAKGSSSGSRHRKSTNGMVGPAKAGCQKEAGGGKLIVWSKNSGEKALQCGQTSDKAIDNARGDNANGHRLIVKLSNPGRSPAPSANGGTIDDTVISGSRGSSPIASDKHDASDNKIKVKTDVSHGNAAPEVNTESWQSNEVKDSFPEAEDGDRSSTGIPSEERSRIGEEIEKTSEISKKVLSPGRGKENNTTKGLSDAEIDKTGEKVRATAVSVKSRHHFSKGISIGPDDGGMKLLAIVAASEPSKDEQVFVSSPGRPENVTDDGSLEGSAIKCSTSVLNSQPGDDEDNKTSIGTKEVKEFTVSRGHQDAMCIDLSAKSPTTGISPHHKDGLDLSEDLECPYSAAQENLKQPSEISAIASLCTGTLSEHKNVADIKYKHLPSCQATNQSTEQTTTELDCVSRPKMEEGIITENESKNDDEKQAVSDMEASNVEVSLDKDMNKNTADIKMIPVEEESGAVTADKDFTKPSNCIQNVSEGTSEIATGVGNSTLHTDAQGRRLHHSVTNEQIRDTEPHHAKQVQDSAGDEDKQKNVDVDDQNSPRSRSMADSDDSQETVTEKGEDMEVQKTAGAAGSDEVDQMSHVPVVADRKIMEPNAVQDSGLDNSDNGREKCKKECEMSSLATSSATSTLISKEQQQFVEPKIPNVQISELDAAEKVVTETIKPGEGVIGVRDTSVKLDFDLNEGFAIDETNQDDAMISAPTSLVVPISSAPEMLMSNSSGLAAPIAVAAKAKGLLMPPASPLRSRGEPGWKGSAATSAFRPTEPRRTPERQQITYEGPSVDTTSSASGANASQSCPILNIDLNVPDEGVAEDGLTTRLTAKVKSSELATASGNDLLPSTRELSASSRSASIGRLDLDLNRAEDCEESGPAAPNTERDTAILQGSSMKSFANGYAHGDSHAARGFDLNDGPCIEDLGNEPITWNSSTKSHGNFYLPNVSGWGVNGEIMNMKTWLPPGNAHSGLAIPSIYSDRNERSYPVAAVSATQHILSSAPGPPYGGDSYKGPVITSSSSIAYPTATQPTYVPYGGFPFGSSFPLATASFSGGPTPYVESTGTPCFPAVHSQLVSAGAVSSSGVRPYVMSLADASGIEGARKRPKPNLDLNAGPGTVDIEVREDRVASRQFSVADSQVSMEQQTRAYYQTTASGVTPMKRKEPEGGWDLHSVGYVQPPWQ